MELEAQNEQNSQNYKQEIQSLTEKLTTQEEKLNELEIKQTETKKDLTGFISYSLSLCALGLSTEE